MQHSAIRVAHCDTRGPGRITLTGSRARRRAVRQGRRRGRAPRRSAKQQLDYWARVGRAVSSRHTAARQKVEAALAGELALAELSEEEGVVFNAEVSAAIQEGLADADDGQVRAGRGITT